MLHALVVTVHVLACIFLCIIVLAQSGQSADLAAAFGGQGSQTAFGPRGTATVLTRATAWLAVIFMITSIALSIMQSQPPSKSVFGKQKTEQSQPVKK